MRNLFHFFFPFLFCILLLSNKVLSQDTIRVCVYNLLYYGLETDFCTSSNNNIVDKELQMRKIIKHIRPAILGVNEMAASPAMCNRFLTHVLNTEGVNYYNRVDYYNTANSSIVNMLYYDTRKIAYHSHYILSSYIRDINMYKLYHKSPDLHITNDTTFIYCILAHLKAGNSENDLYGRKMMTSYAMNNLNNLGINDNILFMGDLNTKTHLEECFQNLIAHPNSQIAFNDPVNKLGAWYNNSAFRFYHTQSTNVSSNNCVAGGGLDDRFDFILINNHVKNNSKQVQYINGSYTTVGQDGQRFKQAINNPANNQITPDLAYALFKASDHLPVSLELLVNRLPAALENHEQNELYVTWHYQNNSLNVELISEASGEMQIRIFEINGRQLFESFRVIERGHNSISTNVELKSAYLYILHLTDTKNRFSRAFKLPIL